MPGSTVQRFELGLAGTPFFPESSSGVCGHLEARFARSEIFYSYPQDPQALNDSPRPPTKLTWNPRIVILERTVVHTGPFSPVVLNFGFGSPSGGPCSKNYINLTSQSFHVFWSIFVGVYGVSCGPP